MTEIKDENAQVSPEGVTIKLVWGNSSNVPTIYANNLYITHAGSEFYLVFGEMSPVTEFNLDELPEHLEIKPVAKIAVTPENMIRFAEAISENIAKFKEKIEKLKEQEDGNFDH
jgi:hypothetical protein